MDLQQIQTLVSVAGAVLVMGALGGVAWMGASEFRLRAIRRGRLQGGAQTVVQSGGRGGPGGAISDRLVAGVRRLGQQDAVRDPAKLSVLRNQLVQAGFYNREAPVIYLGIRALALVLATVGVIVILPLIAGGKAGLTG